MQNRFASYRRALLACAMLPLSMIVTTFPAYAQDPSPAAFDSIAAWAAGTHTAPGFTMIVVFRGQVPYVRSFGVADVAAKAPVTPDTRFAIGSLSKQFVAVSILKLAEEGRLSLDDPLSKYLPAMPNAQQITVRELLYQTSGLHNFPRTDEHHWPLHGVIPPDSLFAILATDKPDFAPGTAWEYSNTNYAVLAEIVAKVSGMPYGLYLQRRIFTPAQMFTSGSGYVSQAGTATPYQGKAPFRKEPSLSLDLFYGAGDVVSTASDLAKWDLALMNGTLLDDSSMRELWTAGTLSDGKPVNYAMGFVPTTLDGHREVWHNGLTPGAGGYCFNAIFPDDGLAVIVLSNGAYFSGKPERIARDVLEAYFPVTATR
ncbi:MAG TPA: serine hydrolase domain-containing protein [Gemmatimonadaceae bacterium]